MTLAVGIVLAVLAMAVVLFLTEWLSVDLVAVLVFLVLAVSGVIGHEEAIAGFSNTAVVTVASVLVLGAGLMRTGVANLVGRQVLRVAGRGEIRLTVVLMLTVGVLSGFMNNIGVAALLLPAVLDICRRLDRAPSKLLMPLAFASLLGGLTTLIGTAPNILINGALTDAGHAGFGLFTFTPVGLAAVGAGTLYMVTIGRRLLPERDMAKEGRRDRRLEETYGLGKRLCGMAIPAGSALSGKTLAESRLGSALGLNVIAITRDGQTSLAPGADARLREGDRLLVEGRLDRLNQMRGWRHLVLDGDRFTAERLRAIEVDMAVVRLHEASPLVGSTLLESGFRRRYGVNVLAIVRGDDVRVEALATRPLMVGDELVLQGTAATLTRLADLDDFADYRALTTEGAGRYRLHDRMIAVTVPEGSLLAGQMLAESRLGNAFDLTVLGLLHEGQTRLTPDPGEEFRPGDTLLVQGRPDDLLTVQGLQQLEVREEGAEAAPQIESGDVVLREVMLAPGSERAGTTVREMRFRERYGLTVVAIWSEGHAYRSEIRDRPVGLGDVLLVHGPREKVELLQADRDFLALSAEDEAEVDESKAPLGLAIMAGVIVTVLLGWLPIFLAAPAGAVLMITTGCLSVDDAYRSIEWRAIVLIAGMLSLGVAMEQTGTAALLADRVLGSVAVAGPLAVLAALYWLTALSAQVMPTAAVAVLIAPIALEAGVELGLDPQALLMVVAIGASSAFMSPVGHPVNLMVMGLGGYRFADYTRVGLGLVLLNFVIALTLVPLLFPLTEG